MNKLEMLLEHFYKIMWCEFSAREVMSDDEIIYLIGVSGLNTLHDYGRLKACGQKDGHTMYKIDKSYI